MSIFRLLICNSYHQFSTGMISSDLDLMSHPKGFMEALLGHVGGSKKERRWGHQLCGRLWPGGYISLPRHLVFPQKPSQGYFPADLVEQ